MYIPCPACNKRLQIPDNKLPTDHPVRITCPACQQRFSYDPRRANPPGGATVEAGAAQPGTTAMPHRTTMADSNVMQALVCLDNPEHQAACQQAIHALGYMSDVMPNQFKALESLRETAYRLGCRKF